MGFIAKEGDVFPEKSIPLLVCPIATTPAEAGMADRAAKEATARIMSQVVTLLEEIRGEQAPNLPFRSVKDQ